MSREWLRVQGFKLVGFASVVILLQLVGATPATADVDPLATISIGTTSLTIESNEIIQLGADLVSGQLVASDDAFELTVGHVLDGAAQRLGLA